MTDTIKALNKIGLRTKQATVYLALLSMGEAKITDLAIQANLKRPTVYLVISELELLGLVYKIIKGKQKIYSAAHPKRISELLEFRKNKYQELLPELISSYSAAPGQSRVQMLEGIEGLKQAYREALNMLPQKNSEQLWISNISSFLERFPDMLSEYIRTLNKFPKAKIREILFGKKPANEYFGETKIKQRPNHQVRYLVNKNDGGETDQLITENRIVFFSFGAKPFALIIESPEMAKTQKFLFENIWSTI